MRAAILLALTVALGMRTPPACADLLTEAIGADAATRDDVEHRIRALVVHRAEDDRDAFATDITALEARDDLRRDAGLPPTGLTDNARYLGAAMAATRDARRDALHEVLDAHPDPLVRRLTEFQLEHADDGAAADQLLVNDRHNRRAVVVNDAIRPFGVFSGLTALGALNPFLLAGSALDSLSTTAVNLWHYNRLSTPEREALARYRTQLSRDPDTMDAPGMARAIRRLGVKRARALCDETRAQGTKALEQGDLDHATFFLQTAARLPDCDAAAPLDELALAAARQAAREDAGRWPADDVLRPDTDDERRDHDALAVTTVLGDPAAMVEAARRFDDQYDDSPLAPSARYVLAVGHDLAGEHTESRTALAEVADDDDRSVGRHAAAILASTDYDRLDALHAAERRHTRDTVRYVLFGGTLDGRSAIYSTARLGAGGLQAAQTLGMFNVLGVATRAWQAWRHDPVSNQTIIDRGEELLARTPQGPEAAEAHARLAVAYERAGAYGRALMHYRATPDPDPDEIARLEEKLADDLLETAERHHDDPRLLEAVVRHFGTTDAAETAREKLRDRSPPADAVVPRDTLVASPALLGPDALDLDAALLDGKRDNGELADQGVMLADGALRLTLENRDGDGEHVDTRPLGPDAYARARAAAQETLYTGLLTAERRDPDTGRFERYIPVFLQGSIDGGGGVYVSPAIKLRRYRSEDARLYE